MEIIKIRCHSCNKNVECKNPIRVTIPNKKSKAGAVQAVRGTCPSCDSQVYKIIGHS